MNESGSSSSPTVKSPKRRYHHSLRGRPATLPHRSASHAAGGGPGKPASGCAADPSLNGSRMSLPGGGIVSAMLSARCQGGSRDPCCPAMLLGDASSGADYVHVRKLP